MSGLVFFVRSAGGYEMEEFYNYSVEYLCFGDLKSLKNNIKCLIDNNQTLLLVDSKFEADSPSSYIVDESIKSPRVILTERPVRVKGHKRMEIVFSGNKLSYSKLYLFLTELAAITNEAILQKNYKLDGIIDEIIFPFGVGLSFGKELNLKKPLSQFDQKFIFPPEIGYMDLPEETHEQRISALKEFKNKTLVWIDRCYN
jgi:hypothetical protein